MPTYAQLANEPAWVAQYTPPVMLTELINPLRMLFGLGESSIGAAGDNNHTYGRHRSRDWCLGSRYCTNRAYGTQDPRDQRGSGGWYRAVDVGIQGEQLQAASRRMDALARSGRCPGLAEWFGTFDGQTVVGWFEGGPSISDDSHLYHLHIGVWTELANDAATMRLLYATIADTDASTGDDDMPMYLLKTPTGHQYRGDGLWYAPIETGAELEGWQNLVPPERRFEGVNLEWWGRDVTTVALAGSGGGSTGGPVDYDRIEKIVDKELDEQSLGGADKDQ